MISFTFIEYAIIGLIASLPEVLSFCCFVILFSFLFFFSSIRVRRIIILLLASAKSDKIFVVYFVKARIIRQQFLIRLLQKYRGR